LLIFQTAGDADLRRIFAHLADKPKSKANGPEEITPRLRSLKEMLGKVRSHAAAKTLFPDAWGKLVTALEGLTRN
jgi:hypothetical protein